MEDMDSMDQPAWVTRAATDAISGAAQVLPAQQMGSDGDFHTSTLADDNSAVDESKFTHMALGVDVTPPANKVEDTVISTLPKPNNLDKQTLMMETLFPDGIAVHNISRAVLISSIIDELVSFAEGDEVSQSAIHDLTRE